jgi:hypothetical protein
MAYKNNDQYFAASESDNLVCYLKDKSDVWFNSLTSGEYLDKIKRSWQAYYGFYYESSHAISFGGESGELINLPINHYGNIASHILTMVTATRPSFQARSVNTDVKSQIQTNLANGLLEYYMRDKRLEQDLKSAVEYAVVMGSGYIKMEWNATTGEIYDYVEPEYEQAVDEMGMPIFDEMGQPVYETDEDGEPIVAREGVPLYSGDIVYKVLSPFDVVFDPTKSDNNHDWQLARSFKNKYDLAAKYPELADKIKKLKTKNDINTSRISMTAYDETTDVPVYEFYHKPTESLPKGRYVMYLDEDVVLEDTVLIYKNLPIFRIASRNIIGTPFSYTAMFDLLPIQDAVNSLYSTIMTNQTTFGVQNVYVERGSDVQVEQISDGLNFIQGNPGFNPPVPLNLTNTPAEIFNFVKQLEQVMETISGVNSVARGNPESQLKSGNALALIQSQALQFISSLQQSYIQLIEDVGTNTVELLKTFAKTPRVAAIAGKSNTTYMKEFTSDDLSSITRVIVDAGNALAQTTAGRVEMASQMMQMGIITTPEQYISVINTGKLETMTEGQNKELLLVRAERERLVDGSTPVVAVLTDAHSLHIREHKAVLADPDLRMDADLVQRTLSHIQEHINILSDPNVANILSLLGEQPLGPPMGTPVAPENAAPAQPNQQGQEEVAGLIANPEAQSVAATANQGQLPAPATPAGSGTVLPEQPTSPEQAMAQQMGGGIPPKK